MDQNVSGRPIARSCSGFEDRNMRGLIVTEGPDRSQAAETTRTIREHRGMGPAPSVRA